MDHHTTVVVMGNCLASGSHAWWGGQVADILGAQKAEAADQAVLHYIHSHKTGALFKAALRCGGLIGGASPDQLGTLTEFGEHFGLAFQITDDILDEVGEAEALGKAVGRDREMGKLTYPSLFGLEKARAMAQESAAVLGGLEGLPVRSQVLQELP